MSLLALATAADPCPGCITSIDVYVVELGWRYYVMYAVPLAGAAALFLAVARWGWRAAVVGFIAGQVTVMAVYAALASWRWLTPGDVGLMALVAVTIWSVPAGAALLLGGAAHWLARALSRRRRRRASEG